MSPVFEVDGSTISNVRVISLALPERSRASTRSVSCVPAGTSGTTMSATQGPAADSRTVRPDIVTRTPATPPASLTSASTRIVEPAAAVAGGLKVMAGAVVSASAATCTTRVAVARLPAASTASARTVSGPAGRVGGTGSVSSYGENSSTSVATSSTKNSTRAMPDAS